MFALFSIQYPLHIRLPPPLDASTKMVGAARTRGSRRTSEWTCPPRQQTRPVTSMDASRKKNGCVRPEEQGPSLNASASTYLAGRVHWFERQESDKVWKNANHVPIPDRNPEYYHITGQNIRSRISKLTYLQHFNHGYVCVYLTGNHGCSSYEITFRQASVTITVYRICQLTVNQRALKSV